MYKKPFLLLAVVFVFFSACDRKPFVEHKLKFEKVADGCSQTPQPFRMNSNFGGERYEFEKCLSADFTRDQLTTSRRGDTVVVSFKQPESSKAKAIFSIILDIDSYPKYDVITIDGETYAIVSSKQ